MNDKIQNINTNICHDEDEIDLKELLKTILKYKKFIIIFTVGITLVAAAYSFFVIPTYEAKGLIEIGSYKKIYSNANQDDTIVLIDNPYKLKTLLDIIFIESYHNNKNRTSWVESIKIPKKSLSFLEIIARAHSEENAVKKINDVLHYIQNKHKTILEDIKDNRLLQIHQIENKIINLKKFELPLIVKSINKNKSDIKFYKNFLERLNLKFEKIGKKDVTFSTLLLMQQRDTKEILFRLENKLFSLEQSKKDLTLKIDELVYKKTEIQDLLKPYNYKNSDIVGKIITSNYPVKPKKKLIIMVAFVTGLILSIFLVFFIEFIKSFKEED